MEIVPGPSDALVLYCKFVLKKKKYNADGTLLCCKARLVICGNRHTVDWEDTFAPVVDITTVRLRLAIAAQKGW